jgi:hypothetical protein
MVPDTPTGNNRGYALLVAIFAVTVFAVMILAARGLWETEIRRELEAELVFRARQYVAAIERFNQTNNNLSPPNLDILLEKKLIRKLYPDPISEDGSWNAVMQPLSGGEKKLLIVPLEIIPKLRTRARLVGVCSTSPAEGYREYRSKKSYQEWAFYVGEDPDTDMPELEFVH